ncbi:pyroglutamyl-peptidase I family protein, partial [Staphylococcus haemolyticus]
MKILVRGFDGFGGEKINGGLDPLNQLHNTIPQHTISNLQIPTLFHQSKHLIHKHLPNPNYHLLFSIPQPPPRYHLTPHRLPINIHDPRIPDNKAN